MDVKLTITQVLDAQTINGKNGKTYTKFSFVGTTDGQYPKKLFLTCMDEEKWQKFNIQVGKTYNIGFDVSSREWNGKWFTEATCYKAFMLDGQDNGEQQTAPPAKAQENGSSDLPF